MRIEGLIYRRMPLGGIDDQPITLDPGDADVDPIPMSVPTPTIAVALGGNGEGGSEAPIQTLGGEVVPPGAVPLDEATDFKITHLIPLFVIVGIMVAAAVIGRTWGRIWHSREAAIQRKRRKDARRAARELYEERRLQRQAARQARANSGWGHYSPSVDSDAGKSEEYDSDHSQKERRGPLSSLVSAIAPVKPTDEDSLPITRPRAGRHEAGVQANSWFAVQLRRLSGWQSVQNDAYDSIYTHAAQPSLARQSSNRERSRRGRAYEGSEAGASLLEDQGVANELGQCNTRSAKTSGSRLSTMRLRGTWDRIKKHITGNIGWGYSGKAPGIAERREIVARASEVSGLWTRTPGGDGMAYLPHVSSGLLLPPRLGEPYMPGQGPESEGMRPPAGRARNRDRSFSPPTLLAPPNTVRQMVTSLSQTGIAGVAGVFNALSGRGRGGDRSRGQHQRLGTSDDYEQPEPIHRTASIHTHANGRRCSLDEPQHLPPPHVRAPPKLESVPDQSAWPAAPDAVVRSPEKRAREAFRGPAPLLRTQTLASHSVPAFDTGLTFKPLTRATTIARIEPQREEVGPHGETPEDMPARRFILGDDDTPMSSPSAQRLARSKTSAVSRSPAISRRRGVPRTKSNLAEETSLLGRANAGEDEEESSSDEEEIKPKRMLVSSTARSSKTLYNARATPPRQRVTRADSSPAISSPVVSPPKLQAPHTSYADLLQFNNGLPLEEEGVDGGDEEESASEPEIVPASLPKLDSRHLARSQDIIMLAAEPAPEVLELKEGMWDDDAAEARRDSVATSVEGEAPPSLVSSYGSSSDESSGPSEVHTSSADEDGDTYSPMKRLRNSRSAKSLHGVELVGEDFMSAVAAFDVGIDQAIADVLAVGIMSPVDTTPKKAQATPKATPRRAAAVARAAAASGKTVTPTQSPGTPLGRRKTWQRENGRWACVEGEITASPSFGSPLAGAASPPTGCSPMRPGHTFPSALLIGSPLVTSSPKPAKITSINSPSPASLRAREDLFFASPQIGTPTRSPSKVQPAIASPLRGSSSDDEGEAPLQLNDGSASPKRRAAVARRPPRRYQAALGGEPTASPKRVVNTPPRRALTEDVFDDARSQAGSEVSSCVSDSARSMRSPGKLRTPAERERERQAAVNTVQDIVALGLAQRQQAC